MNNFNNGPVVITSEIHHEKDQHRSTTNIADQLGASPYSNIAVGRIQPEQYVSTSPVRVPTRHSLTAEQRPKQKVRKPSKQWLENKSGMLFDTREILVSHCSLNHSCRRIRVEY
jgi:hypothetical protein